MKTTNQTEDEQAPTVEASTGADLLRPLVLGPAMHGGTSEVILGVVVGDLLAISDEGRTPLVTYSGQMGSAAVPARTVVDVSGVHVGKQVTLMFDGGDPTKPIIMGVLHESEGWPLEPAPNEVEVDADGKRLVVTARDQLVLRCGSASVTLTKDGKVLIEGTYLSSHSSGVNRIKGGSVQIN